MLLFYFVKNKVIGERSIQRHVKNNKSFYSDSPVVCINIVTCGSQQLEWYASHSLYYHTTH